MPTFNTTDPKPGYVYDQAVDTWFPLLGIAPGSSVVRWRKTAAGAETSVSGLDDLGATLSYNAGTEQVYLNGVLLVRTEDYLATTGTSVTGLTALAASDVIEVISFNATNVQITDALLETDINAKGDLVVGAAVDTAAILASGTNGQVLSVNTATATGLEWVTSDDANAIQNAIVDAKGDIIAATAADTVARLAVGTNGQVLTAASGEATGLQWATPSSGGMTLLETLTLSGASVTSSSIPGTYKNLQIVVRNFRPATDTAALNARLNGDSTTSYLTTTSNSNTGAWANTALALTDDSDNGASSMSAVTTFYDYANALTYKIGESLSVVANPTTPANPQWQKRYQFWDDTSAITTITFLPASGNFTSGSILIYGVN